MNKSIFDIRFLVPPTLTLVLIFLSSPNYFVFILSRYNSTEVGAVLSSIILVLGVIISGVVEYLIKEVEMRKWNYNNDEVINLKNILTKTADNTSHQASFYELGTWIALGALNEKYKGVFDQIQKRWYWTTANYNLFTATLIALTCIAIKNILYLHVSLYLLFSLLISFFCLYIFLINGNDSYKDVCEMHKMVLDNYSDLTKEKGSAKINT